MRRLLQEEFEDSKEVIRIRKSENRQQNDKQKNKRTNNDLQITQLEIELHEPH